MSKKNKTPKPLTSEEQLSLRNNAKSEWIRLRDLQADEDALKRIERFKTRFGFCETVYKVLLDEYLYRKEGKRIDPREMGVTMLQAPYALNYAGYDYDRNLLSKLFSSNDTVGKRSAKMIRNHLTHGMKQSAVDEFLAREQELYGYMDTFLEKIESFDEE